MEGEEENEQSQSEPHIVTVMAETVTLHVLVKVE